MSNHQNDRLTLHHVTVEAFTDEHGPAVMLTQEDGSGESPTVVLHPWQLRAACHHLGILHADPEAERAAARLTRRLRALVERIEHLNHYLHTLSDMEHANLSYEQTYSQATADLAAEFIEDIEGSAPRQGETREPQQGELL